MVGVDLLLQTPLSGILLGGIYALAVIGQWCEGMQHLVYHDDGEAAIDLKYPMPAWDER